MDDSNKAVTSLAQSVEYIYRTDIANLDNHGLLLPSVTRVLSSKQRGPGFKSQPGTVGIPVTIMWGARPG